MIALIVIGSIIAYTFMAFLVGGLCWNTRPNRCHNCAADRYCGKDHGAAASMVGLFWPFMAIGVGALVLSKYLADGPERRALKRKAKEAALQRAKEEREENYRKALTMLREAGVNVDGVLQ